MPKRKRTQIEPMMDRFARMLLYEATGGSIGNKPRAQKVDPSGPTFQEKRALLDSLIKLRGLDEKYKAPDDDTGLETMRRRLNGRGETVSGRSDPPAPGEDASA